MTDDLDRILEGPEPPYPPAPIGTTDVRSAIRGAQDAALARFEARVVRGVEEHAEFRRAEAYHRARLLALKQHLSVFRGVMSAADNRGLARFEGGTRSMRNPNVLDQLIFKGRERFPAITAWPLAYWRQSSGWRADMRTDPRYVVALTPRGAWWRGQVIGREGGKFRFSTIESARLEGLTGSFFSPIGARPDNEPSDDSTRDTTIDRAIVGSIANLMVAFGLSWPDRP